MQIEFFLRECADIALEKFCNMTKAKFKYSFPVEWNQVLKMSESVFSLFETFILYLCCKFL